MKIIQFFLTLLFGMYLFAGDIQAENYSAKTDSLSTAEPDSIEINTDWSQFLTPEYHNENYLSPVYHGMKIFIPDSTITDTMPILDPPPVDEGIFLNLPPYCGDIYEKQKSEKREKQKEEKKEK